MEVLKKGNWTKILECSTCNAELLIKKDDVSFRGGTREEPTQEFYCICPECNCSCLIHPNDVPKNIQEKLFNLATSG